MPAEVQEMIRHVIRSPLFWSVLAALCLTLTLTEMRRMPDLRFWPLAGYCWLTMVSWWFAVDKGMR